MVLLSVLNSVINFSLGLTVLILNHVTIKEGALLRKQLHRNKLMN